VVTYNTALNRPAFQSSTYSNIYGRYAANLANDGNVNTLQTRNYKPACALARVVESNPWWAVDLGKPTTVYKVNFISTASSGM